MRGERLMNQRQICERKVAFPSEASAATASDATSLRHYKCRCCEGWHLTKKGTGQDFTHGPVWARAQRMMDLSSAKNLTDLEWGELDRHRAFFRVLKGAMLDPATRETERQRAAS